MIDLHDITIEYDGRNLFSPVSISVGSGEIICIMGRSGVGKTSLLNYIANIIDDSFTVFQDSHQLFPWYTVHKNLDLVSHNYIDTVNEWKISDLLNHCPNELSGGQHQRFTLIRALHSGFNNILCDEPLSGLDTLTKISVLQDFKQKIVDNDLSCIWVTHDYSEAQVIADRVFLLTENGLNDEASGIK